MPLYPEWPKSGQRSRDQKPLRTLLSCSAQLRVQVMLRGTILYRVEVTASQLDKPYLTPLSIAGCGQLQLGAAHWATSVALLQVDN